jgi:Pyridoxamine 5'-phosphate oxidase
MGTDDKNVQAGITGAGSGRRGPAAAPSSRARPGARSPVALPREQRRGRSIAMGKAELDAVLTEQRTCRVATASQDGPHLTPLWYVWDGTALWLYSVVRSQRWTDISRGSVRVAAARELGVLPPPGRQCWDGSR